MGIKRFEEIIAWQKALDFSVQIYGSFQHLKDYSFTDQIHRASISVMNNIAEGFERQTVKEFRQYLYMAKGSCAEVRSMLYLAEKLEYLDFESQIPLVQSSDEISKILSGLIKSLSPVPS